MPQDSLTQQVIHGEFTSFGMDILTTMLGIQEHLDNIKVGQEVSLMAYFEGSSLFVEDL